MIHLYCSCYPYQSAWYIFCLGDTVPEDEFDDWEVSGNIEEVTCPYCIRIDKELTEQMRADGLLDDAGNLKPYEELDASLKIGAINESK